MEDWIMNKPIDELTLREGHEVLRVLDIYRSSNAFLAERVRYRMIVDHFKPAPKKKKKGRQLRLDDAGLDIHVKRAVRG